MGTLRLFTFSLAAFLLPSAAFAGAAITYHGRLLDADGKPVEASAVHFKIQVRSPGATDCLLVEESRTVDMRNSDGVFVIPIGDGQGARSGGDPGMTIEEAFSNNSAVTRNGLTCNSGHSYAPTALDARKLVVTFNDGSGAGDQVLPPMDINYVPLALHSEEAASALKVGSTPASQIMSVASGSAAPLSAANFSELMLLVNGNSGSYVKTSTVPTCSSGEVLKGTGGAFACVTVPGGADTLAGLACADGKILKRAGGAWTCADEAGGSTEHDPTVQAYAKVAPGAGLKVAAGAVAADFGSGAGKIVEGNDSRLSDPRAPNGVAIGDLEGSYPNPSVKGLRGNAIAATSPQDGQIYQWVNSTTEWQPKFLSFADLRKTDGTAQMPSTCAANQTLSWSSIADIFSCADIGSLDASKITSGTLSASRLPADTVILTCADGKIAKRVAGAWTCGDDVGVAAELDPSVKTYAKNDPGTGLKIVSNLLVPDFGSGAGKVVEGNDSRLSDNRVASDLNNVVSTGVIQRTGAGTFAALGVAAPLGISAGNIGLSVGSGLILSSGNLVPDFGTGAGQVARGNDSRFPASACAAGQVNRWDGTAWQCVTPTASNAAATANATSIIDFATGNAQYTTSSCGNFTLDNLKDGGFYTFVVQGTTAATCNFSAYSDAGSTPLTVHLPSNYGATTSGSHTAFTFNVVGTHVYVTWSAGYTGLPSGNWIYLTISADTQNYNIFTAAGSPASAVNVQVTINEGVVVGSASTASGAIDTGAFPSGSYIRIVNRGSIIGRGGNGGNGGGTTSSPTGGSNGGDGGPALVLHFPVTIANFGAIWGGGGGGGGGG